MKFTYIIFFFVSILVITYFTFISKILSEIDDGNPINLENNENPQNLDKMGNFEEIVKKLKQISISNTVIISFFDSFIWQEFLYFYIHSIKANEINNFLAFSYDSKGVNLCIENKFVCDLVFTNNTVKYLRENTYQSKGFLERMFIRNEVIYKLLKAGISLIITDVDILYLKNPLYRVIEGDPDVAVSKNRPTGELNGGFFYLKYCPNSIKMFEYIMALHPQFPEDNDQDLLNKAVLEAKKYAKIKTLKRKEFYNGLEFFEFNHLFFADQLNQLTENTYTIHNNWILGFTGKEYRLKELHLYKFDYDGYYSSEKNNYIMLDYGDQERTLENDKVTLMLGMYLGNISNRIVILPRFRCYTVDFKFTTICKSNNDECNFLVLWNIKRFDSVFNGKYRESVYILYI